jgi:hypothetical protein
MSSSYPPPLDPFARRIVVRCVNPETGEYRAWLSGLESQRVTAWDREEAIVLCLEQHADRLQIIIYDMD